MTDKVVTIQDLWPNWWRNAELQRIVSETHEALEQTGPSRLDGKERRNALRAAVERGIVVALTEAGVVIT